MKFEDALVFPNTPIREVLRRIDDASTQLALVVDQEGRLLGTATDGDIRRGLLAGLELHSPIKACMHEDPLAIASDTNDGDVVALLRTRGLRHAPLVDSERRVIGLKVLDELLAARRRDNPVVLMAGGLGSRLGGLTRDTPKPMLPISGRPILEHILLRMVDQGFHSFWLAVNYKAEVIEQHFGDGAKFGCSVRYLREDKPLGTAGALSLLPERSDLPLLVANGDLLTTIDFGALLDHHERSGAIGTMAVRPHEVQIPFGVIETDEDRFVTVHEKPVLQHVIAAGIYVLSPAAVAVVPSDSFFDMPEVFSRLVELGKQATVYRMADYWIDIGRPPDLERAARDFEAQAAGGPESA